MWFERVAASGAVVIPGYTSSVKTAVSIPDELFEAADRLAERRNMSRSALYAEALRRLIADDTALDITAQLDEVYAHVDNSLDQPIAAAQADVLREQW